MSVSQIKMEMRKDEKHTSSNGRGDLRARSIKRHETIDKTSGAKLKNALLPVLRKHIVVMGDDMCGKSELINKFFELYQQEGDKNIIHVSVNDQECRLYISEDLILSRKEVIRSQMDPQFVPQPHVALCCYNIMDSKTLKKISSDIVPTIRKNYEGMPIIVVGCKEDLRGDEKLINDLRRMNLFPVSENEGRRVAKECHAHTYIECSTKNSATIEKVLKTAVEAAVLDDGLNLFADQLITENTVNSSKAILHNSSSDDNEEATRQRTVNVSSVNNKNFGRRKKEKNRNMNNTKCIVM
ncbi:hypothetical protein SNEBB_007180 [Seison nebaliae]|nr:hypothetical protein SNEBB_007180 [Seison nebaliae]